MMCLVRNFELMIGHLILEGDNVLVPCYEQVEYLTPKFHFMVHYWRIIHNYGPLRNFWCMRFEGKHATGLQTARNSASRINLTQTIAIDHQLRLTYRLSSDEIFKNIINLGPRTRTT
ncbi:hypothetical protein X777_00712, partial [Ooceraea biroi]